MTVSTRRCAIPRRPVAFYRVVLSCLLAVCVISWSSPAQTAPTAQAAPPGFIAEQLIRPALIGEGLFRWFGFRVYSARLWASNGQIDSAAPTRSPIALQLTYARPLKGKDIAQRSAEEIRALKLTDEKTLSQWQDQMSGIFPDVREGDSLTGITDSEGATHFFLNGNLLSRVNDPAFTAAFFAIWLNINTSAPGLREKLLAGLNR